MITTQTVFRSFSVWEGFGVEDLSYGIRSESLAPFCRLMFVVSVLHFIGQSAEDLFQLFAWFEVDFRGNINSISNRVACCAEPLVCHEPKLI